MRLMSEGGVTAVGSDEPVVGSSEVRRLEEQVRELERLLGRKTMENEILREALARSDSKKTDLAAAVAAEGRFAMTRVAEALGVSRSNLAERAKGTAPPRGPYRKAGDDELLPLIRRLVGERPTYGYRRITALVNREMAKNGRPGTWGRWAFHEFRDVLDMKTELRKVIDDAVAAHTPEPA